MPDSKVERRKTSRLAAFLVLAVCQLAVSGRLALAAPAEAAAPAPPSSEVSRLLARHLQALGGAERIAALAGSRTTATVAGFGLTGSLVTWTRSPNLIRNELDMGFFTQVSGFDGSEAWKVDQNGHPARLEGLESELLRAEALFGNYLYCFPERSGAEYRYLGAGEAGEEKTVRLAVTLPGSNPVILHFHPGSWLIVRTEAELDLLHATSDYGDYRSVEGVQVSFSCRQSTGDPRFDVELRIQEALLGEVREEAFFSLAGAARGSEDFVLTAGDAALDMPMTLANGHVYLSAAVNGEGGKNFILDSGASASVLNASTASAQGVIPFGQLQVIGAAGRGEAAFTRVETLTLPGVEIRNQRLMAVDLDSLQPYEGMRVDGILGYDFLSRFVVKIDYEKGTVSAILPSAFVYQGSGETLELSLEANVPVVLAVVEGQTSGRFLVDTGAGLALAFHRRFIEDHQLLRGRRDKREIYTGGVGGVVRQVSARLSSFRLGGYTFRNVPAVFAVAEGEGIGAHPRLAGIIGGSLLRQFTVYFDYGGRRLILEPNSLFGQPLPVDRSGLQLAAGGGGEIIVADVLRRSPARRARIRPGDWILEADGRPAPALGLAGVRELLKGPAGSRVALRLRRGGRQWSVELRLGDPS